MNINRDNYEIFFLDFMEGAICDEDKLQLIAFLEDNPDLKEEFDNFENIKLVEFSESPVFDFKESLKKQNTNTLINETNYHEFFIADAEGDLSNGQKKQLDVFLSQNTELFNEFQLYKEVKLIPDNKIVYPKKASLKKLSVFGFPLNKNTIYQSVSIAASLLLIVGISNYYFQNTTIEKPIADFSSNKIVKNIINQISDNKPVKEVAVIQNSSDNKNNNYQNKSGNSENLKNNKTEVIRNHQSMNTLASKDAIQLSNTNDIQPLTDYNRTYYTSLLDLMAFSDEKIDNENIEISQDKYKTTILNSDFIKNQPIAEAGSFIKNAAILGLSKIEALSSDIKDTYLAVEKRFEKK